jgi:hypothetical protein
MGWLMTRQAELQLHSRLPVRAATISPGNNYRESLQNVEDRCR